MRSFTAGENDAGVRLSRFVLRVTHGLPDSQMYKAFRNRRIKVNGKRAAPEARLCAGDVIELYLNDEFFPGQGGAWRPEVAGPLPDFALVEEAAGLAVLYKPPGVFSHRTARGAAGLLDAFTSSLVQAGRYHPAGENQFAPALCNRLDYGTEGLVLAATTAAALRDANELIRLDAVEKTYLCACLGTPPEGMHTAFHQRDRAAKTVAVSLEDSPGAKPIATGVKVLEEKQGLSLCRMSLLTGRTHQIRAHLAFLGCPVAGDAKYGSPAANHRLGLAHQALCALELAFGPQLPPQSSLLPLAGKKISCAGLAQLPQWWNGL